MKWRILIATGLVSALLLLGGALALAQTGGGYDLSWWTIDGGGGSVSAGGYVLEGSIGQPDASDPLVAGGYALTGGFWNADSGSSRSKVYMPITLK